MTEKTKSTISQAAPWKSDVAWWVVLIKGFIAMALGVYMLVQQTQAAGVIGILLAIYLIISGLLQLYAGLRVKRRGGLASVVRWRGLVGLVIGAFAVAQYFLKFGTLSLSLTIVGLGAFVYGLLGLYLGFADRRRGTHWGTVLNSLLVTLLGAVILYGNWTNTPIITWLGALAVIFGILLIIYAVVRREAASFSSST